MYKYIRQLYRDMKRYIYRKLHKNTIIARQTINSYLWRDDTINIWEMGITYIKAYNSFGRIKVSITTLRPGILIGRKGENIDRLRHSLNNSFNNTVIIDIKECNPFSTKSDI